MMNVQALLWKKYCGELLRILSRDDMHKPVSVEITPFDSKMIDEYHEELLDYAYDAITILGTYVKPAIPGASLDVIQFSQEYKQDLEKEFGSKYSEIDFKISDQIKANSQKGLDLYNKFKRGGSGVALAIGKFIISHDSFDSQRARHVFNYLYNHKSQDFDKKISNEYITWCLYGGNESFELTQNIVSKMNEVN